MATTSKGFVNAIAIVAVALSTVSVRAEQPDKYTKPHEPFTAYGMNARMSIVNPINKNAQKVVQPAVFQEIAPCRLSSTLIHDRYDMPWGGPSYLPNESRSVPSHGVLETATFVDPCSETIPMEAIGLVGRFTVMAAEGDGELHIDPSNPASANAATVLKFKKGESLMFEAGVMFGPGGTFGIATWFAGADVTVDVLGYLLPDPAGAGQKGDQGEKGDTGATGATGATGTTGATGATGTTGATGAKGDTGATGATGATGLKGDTGVKGDTGAKGDIGAKGDTGVTGPKGDTGAIGPIGLIGPIGPKGEMGATGATGPKGEVGANGATGPRGEIGATGATGPKGETGATGATGPKGEVGANGATGPRGEIGATGATGPKGEVGANGATGPRGENGATGAIGPKGEVGATGPRGEIGATGATGPKGEIGPQGPSGLTGQNGPAGPQGPAGPAGGLTVVKGYGCYPPGNNAHNQVTVYDSAVTYSSIVILNYTDAGSNGNALALTAQGQGFFNTTGSPNTCFQYVVLNTAR